MSERQEHLRQKIRAETRRIAVQFVLMIAAALAVGIGIGLTSRLFSPV